MTIASKPTYLSSDDAEISNNPLLAHLPPESENQREAYKRLRQRVKFVDSDRNLSNSIRRRKIRLLSNYYLPADPVHARAMMEIHTGMIDSYLHRNPFSAEGQRYLYGVSPPHDFRPGICFITGHSGMGKTRLCDRTLDALGPQVIKHSTFQNKPFPETQILWLRRNIPAGCNIGKLCRTFGTHVDNVLHRELYGTSFNRLRQRSNMDDVYMSEFIKLARSNHLGALVFDELQNLVGLGSTGEKVIQFLVNLRDELGIPLIVVGTKKAYRLLQNNFSPARRIGEGGYFELIRPQSADDEVWRETCKNAWEYQWVKDPIPFSDEISETLYAHSQGVTGVMISLLKNAQLLAIEEELETVTPTIIARAFSENMGVLHKAIHALASGDPKLIDQWEDLSKDFWANERPIYDVAATRSARDQVDTFKLSDPDDEITLAPLQPSRSSTKKKAPKVLTSDQLKDQVVDASSMRSVIEAFR